MVKIGKLFKRVRKGKDRRIDFTRKVNPVRGIVSLIISIVSFLGLIALSIVSAVYGGNAGLAVGIAGVLLFLVNITGFILAATCLKMYNVNLKITRAGIIGNAFMIVSYISLYIVGIFG